MWEVEHPFPLVPANNFVVPGLTSPFGASSFHRGEADSQFPQRSRQIVFGCGSGVGICQFVAFHSAMAGKPPD